MMSSLLRAEERVGSAFNVDGMLEARSRTRQAIDRIASRIHPGMSEDAAVSMAKQVLVQFGLTLSWHPTRVRFGPNTTHMPRQASPSGTVLRDNDLFIVDIGPRYKAWEGDGGATFTVGQHSDHARCVRDAEIVFHAVRRLWQQEQVTGRELYVFAAEQAAQRGWELNPKRCGHRISDFPHAVLHTGSLGSLPFTPSEMRWMLEIHLCDPGGCFGAFFEDLLLIDDSYYVPAPGV